jgi:hypothetical protein
VTAIFGVVSGESEAQISEWNLRFGRVDRSMTPIAVGGEFFAGRGGRNQPREADIEGLRFL